MNVCGLDPHLGNPALVTVGDSGVLVGFNGEGVLHDVYLLTLFLFFPLSRKAVERGVPRVLSSEFFRRWTMAMRRM